MDFPHGSESIRYATCYKMRHKSLFYWIPLVLLLSCQPNKNDTKTNATIDIQSTTDVLTLFGEHIISTPLYERDIAIHPQGVEIIYTLGDYKQTKRALVIVTATDGIWGSPEIMDFSGKHQDIEPFYANNGNRLFFASNRPIYNDSTRNDYNIWFSDRIEKGWTAPKALDSIINT